METVKILFALLVASSTAFAQPAPPVSTYGQPWTVRMQTTEKFPVSLDYANFLAAGDEISSVDSVAVKIVSRVTPGPTPNPTGIVGEAYAVGTKVIFPLDGTKANSGVSYQVDSVVTSVGGRVVSWPIRVDVLNVTYSQH